MTRSGRLAVEVAGYLAKEGQLPLELMPALVDAVKDDPSSATAQAASGALAELEAANPTIRDEIKSGLQTLHARVYFHVNEESQRDSANQLAKKLTAQLGEGFLVPGIEARRGPRKTELRFFKQAAKDEAEEILAALKSLKINVVLQNLSSRYESSTKIRPRHYELWLGDDFTGSQ